MNDAVASGRDSGRFALAHDTRRKLGGLPLPIGERVGVRGFGSIERPEPLTPPVSQPKSDLSDFGRFKCRTRVTRVRWEREQTECASRHT